MKPALLLLLIAFSLTASAGNRIIFKVKFTECVGTTGIIEGGLHLDQSKENSEIQFIRNSDCENLKDKELKTLTININSETRTARYINSELLSPESSQTIQPSTSQQRDIRDFDF